MARQQGHPEATFTQVTAAAVRVLKIGDLLHLQFCIRIVSWSLVRMGSTLQGIHQDQLSLHLMPTGKRKVTGEL